MKKTFKALAVLSAFFLVACGGNSGNKPNNDTFANSKEKCEYVAQQIATNLFGSAVFDTDYMYDESEDMYYIPVQWDGDSAQTALDEAPAYLLDGVKCDEAASYNSELEYYFAYYSYDEVLIDIYSYDDSDYGIVVEYDIYLDEENGGTTGEDTGESSSESDDNPSDGTATYNSASVISVTKAIATSVFGEAVLGETYDYDDTYDLYYVAATVSDVASLSAAMTEAVSLLPSGLTCDTESTYDSEGYYYAYYSKDDVLIDVYAMDDEEGYYIEYDVYLDEEEDDPTGGSTTGGTTAGGTGTGTTTSDGYTIATLSFAGMAAENSSADFSSTKVGAVSFAASEGTGSNTPVVYGNGDALRLYSGNKFTVTIDSGMTIDKIVINCTSIGENKVQDATKFTVTGGTYTSTTTTGTVSSVTGSTVVFTQGSTSGHVRVSSVEVYYK